MVLWGKRKESGGTKRRVRGGCSARHAPGRKDHKLFLSPLSFFLSFSPPFFWKHWNISSFSRGFIRSFSIARASLDKIPNEERAGIINSFNSAMELIGWFFFSTFKPNVQKTFLYFEFRMSLFFYFSQCWHILRPWCTFELEGRLFFPSSLKRGVWRPDSESSFFIIMESGVSSLARRLSIIDLFHVYSAQMIPVQWSPGSKFKFGVESLASAL